MPASSNRARRVRWKQLVLLAFAVSALAIAGIGAIAQRRSYGSEQLLWLSAASPGAGERALRAAPRASNARPVQRAATAAPRFDEFAVRSAVNGVPAPPGTGLPRIESVIIHPESIVPLNVNLRVPGVDNAAWSQLTVDERREYAEQVLAALVATYPEVGTNGRRSRVYFSVSIWERFHVAAPLGLADPESPFICIPANHRGQQECDGSTTGAILTVPARQTQYESGPLE